MPPCLYTIVVTSRKSFSIMSINYAKYLHSRSSDHEQLRIEVAFSLACCGRHREKSYCIVALRVFGAGAACDMVYNPLRPRAWARGGGCCSNRGFSRPQDRPEANLLQPPSKGEAASMARGGDALQISMQGPLWRLRLIAVPRSNDAARRLRFKVFRSWA